MVIIIIVGGIFINLLIMYMEKSGKEDNEVVYKSMFFFIIAAVVGMICICLFKKMHYALKIVIAFTTALYLFVSLPIVIKKLKKMNS